MHTEVLGEERKNQVSLQIALMLITIVVAMVLFALERVPASVTGLGVLLFLIVAGLLSPEEAFAGFGSGVVLMLLGILIMTEALRRTGVTDAIGRWILQHTKTSERTFLLVVMAAAVLLGAFMSNTAATAFFLPIVIGLARRANLSPAKFLMPLAFASILASSITLIGTSTNIVVSGLMVGYGMSPLGMFELSPVGLPIALAGLTYMFFLGRRLIPDRIPTEQLEKFCAPLYFSELLIKKDSALVGKTLSQSGLGKELDLKVLRIVRDGSRFIVPRVSTKLEAEDILLVEGEREDILRAGEMDAIAIKAEAELPDYDLAPEEICLTEVILLPDSSLIGRTLKGLDFRLRYGLQVLAINRYGETLRRKLSHVRLRTGDVLVVQGESVHIQALERQDLFRILGSASDRRPNRARAPIAIAVFVGAIAAATFNLLALSVAMLLGALLVFVTRCITPEEAYSRVNWNPLILIACMLGLGKAMEVTGTAGFLADQIVGLMGGAHPIGLLGGFFALTVALTQPMSNQAAAVVVLPVAVQTAGQLNLDPRSFAVMIALAASCSFLTPLEPACLLVYGPGRYRFADFIKVGALLTALIYGIAVLMVPLLWPIRGF
jgi:di/tricarboxylate transporter